MGLAEGIINDTFLIADHCSSSYSPTSTKISATTTAEDANESVQKQLQLNQNRYEEFLEKSARAMDEYPYLREDISCRVELLTAKWEVLNLASLGQDWNSPNNSGREAKDGEDEEIKPSGQFNILPIRNCSVFMCFVNFVNLNEVNSSIFFFHLFQNLF